jgi:hypothetical protein
MKTRPVVVPVQGGKGKVSNARVEEDDDEDDDDEE